MSAADDFLEKLRAGTADEGAGLVIWRLLRILTNGAKIDTSEPEEGWRVRVNRSPDVRYTNLYAEMDKTEQDATRQNPPTAHSTISEIKK